MRLNKILDLKDFLFLVLDHLVDFSLILLGELLHLVSGMSRVVFGDDAAFFFGVDKLVGVAAGVADGDFSGFGECLDLADHS